MTSVHDLVRNNNLEELKNNIVMGKDLNQVDKHSRTGVHLACHSGNLEILQLLIRSKALVDKKAVDGFVAIHFAAISTAEGAPDCIRFLGQKARSIIHSRTSKGNKSALHLALSKARFPVIEALLDIGLDPLAKTSNGQTVMDLAKNASQEIRSLLIARAEARVSGKPVIYSIDRYDDSCVDDSGQGVEMPSLLGKRTAAESIEDASSDNPPTKVPTTVDEKAEVSNTSE